MRRVTVRVPATTANLGPGFDCLGLALGLYNEVILAAAPDGLAASVEGEGANELSTGEDNLVVQAAESVFEYAGRRPSGIILHQINGIPVGSGLGSSAAAVIGGMVAADALIGADLGEEKILRLAAELERHPDNVTPALHGGLTLVNRVNSQLLVEKIEIAPMRVSIVLPSYELPTESARAVLPEYVSMTDAIFNIGRLGLLIRALQTADFDKLTVAVEDRLHQQYRLPLVPGMSDAFEAAWNAGAAAVALSGAGPSIALFAAEGHQRIIKAMKRAYASAGLDCRSWTLPVDIHGSRLTVDDH